MKNNNDLKNIYNKIAKDWGNDDGKFNWWMKGTDVFLSLLSKGANILDVGCGSGYKSKYMFDKGFNVEGIDFSEEMIKFSKEKYNEINFEVLDVYDLDKLNKKFDGIFSQSVLMHLPKKDIINILEKIKSKINENGLIYLTMPEIKENGIEEEIRKENDYGYEYERFFSYYSRDELINYFKELGLKIVYEGIVSSGRSNWINIIGKK